MKLGTTVMRRLGAAAGLTLAAGVLAACGSDGSSDVPDDATVEEFCDSLDPEKALDGLEVDPEAGEEEQADQLEAALKQWREALEDTGTPEDMPDDAREGYEEVLEQFRELDFDQSLEDISKQMDEIDEDSDEAKALEEYVEEECDITM